MNWPVWTLAAALAGGQPTTEEVAAPPEPPKPTMKRETAYGLLMGGTAGMLLLTWAGGMTGATLLDRDRAGDDEIGGVLPVPIAGPFIAANMARSADDGRALYAAMGIQQLAALGVLTAGAIGVSQHRAYDRHHGARYEVSPSGTTAMMAAGFTGATIVYGMTLGLTASDRQRGSRYARRFVIPLVGGIAAAPLAPSYRAGVGALTSSALQIAGVGITATGVALSVRRERRGRNLVVFPMIGREHASVTATFRF